MPMEQIQLTIPKKIVSFVQVNDPQEELLRNAMMLYPYIQRQVISHGLAAKFLGIPKMDLISLYGEMGIPYFDETEEELNQELAAIESIRKKKCSSFLTQHLLFH